VGKELSELRTEEQKLAGIKGKTEAYKKDVKNITKATWRKQKSFPGEIENAAGNVKEMKDLKRRVLKYKPQKMFCKQYQESVLKFNEGTLLKDGKGLAQKKIGRSLCGPGRKAQGGHRSAGQIEKEVSKHPRQPLPSKRAPNLMKGKPFRERFIPGVNVQLFKNHTPWST